MRRYSTMITAIRIVMQVRLKKTILIIGLAAAISIVGMAVWVGLRFVFPVQQQGPRIVQKTVTKDDYFNGTEPVFFQVLAMDPENKSMRVMWQTGEFLRDATTTVAIGCSIDQSRAFYTLGPLETEREIKIERPLYEYADLVSGEKPVVLSGYCMDRQCQTIGRQCTLKVFQ